MSVTGIYVTRKTASCDALLERVAQRPGARRLTPQLVVIDDMATETAETAPPLYNINNNGIFSFADGAVQLDTEHRQAIYRRDRFGELSLYHAEPAPGCTVFSTSLPDIQGIIQGPLDTESLVSMLRLGYTPAPKTLYVGVAKVPANHTATVSVDDAACGLQSNGTLPPIRETTAEAALAELEVLLKESLTRTLDGGAGADVLLSGGVDSGIVTGFVQRFFPDTERRAFTIACEEEGYDESPVAAQTAAIHGLTIQRIPLKPAQIIDLLPRIIALAGEPFADASIIACALAYEAVPAGRIVLTGDGGDELFGGYRRYRAMAMRHRMPEWLDAAQRPLSRFGAALLPAGGDQRSRTALMRRMLTMAGLPRAEAYATFQQLCDAKTAAALLAIEAPEATFPARWQTFLEALPPDGLFPYNALDLQFYLPEDCCRKSELAAQYAKRRVVGPIQCGPVADFALSLPTSLRFNTKAGKLLLRRLAVKHSLLPGDALNAPKRGFGLPLAKWFRQGPLADRITELAATAREWDKTGLLDVSAIVRLADEHRHGRRNNAGPLWMVLCLHAWLTTMPHLYR